MRNSFPQYLRSNLDSVINDHTFPNRVRFIYSDSPTDCGLYGELVVSVILVVFNVFFVAERSLALSLGTLLTLALSFFPAMQFGPKQN